MAEVPTPVYAALLTRFVQELQTRFVVVVQAIDSYVPAIKQLAEQLKQRSGLAVVLYLPASQALQELPDT